MARRKWRPFTDTLAGIHAIVAPADLDEVDEAAKEEAQTGSKAVKPVFDPIAGIHQIMAPAVQSDVDEPPPPA